MSVSISEMVESRHYKQSIREGQLESRFTRVFKIFGANDPLRTDVTSLVPLVGDPWLDQDSGTNDAHIWCIERDYKVISDGAGVVANAIIEMTATYGQTIRQPDPASVSNPGGAVTVWDTNITTQSVHAKTAQFGQTHFPMAATEVGLGINVTSEGAQGFDVLEPVFNLVGRIQRATVDATYRLLVASCMRCVNSGTFAGHAAGTVLLIGFKASQRANGPVDCEFSFLVSPNVTYNVDVTYGAGSTETVAKGGHEYAWEKLKQLVDGTGAILNTVIESVHVATPYFTTSFSVLGL